MGSRGSTKDKLQEESGCRLVMSNRDDYFPGSRLRILVIQGDNAERIGVVLDRVVEHVLLCAGQESTGTGPQGNRQPGEEPEFLGEEPGEFVLRVAVPSLEMFPAMDAGQ